MLPELFASMAKAAGCGDFCQELDRLLKECGVDFVAMSDFGIKREDLPVINENALPCVDSLRWTGSSYPGRISCHFGRIL